MITESKERITSQKQIILDYLKNVTCHPSAEDAYLAVKEKLPRISRGTVYRNLKDLKEKGQTQEIMSQVAHYDGNVSPHAHFICQECDKVFDIFNVCEECNILKSKKTKVGKIKNYQIHLYGICKNCENR